MIEEDVERFYDYMKAIKPYKDITDFVNWCEYNRFFTQTSSTKWHGAYEGGLLHHTLNVTDNLVNITNNMNLTWQSPDSPILVGILHDLCKYDAYVETDSGYTWNEHQPLTGHGEKSVMLASMFFRLTEEEIFCIRWHMGAYENKDTWSNMQEAQIKYPNVMWTHHADMLASRDEAREERNK